MLVSQLGFSHNLSPLICLTDIDRPKGLAFTDVDVDSIRIAWESPQGQVSRYRVTYSSPEDGIHELSPAPDGEEDTAELQGLRPGSEYTVSVVALHDDMESQPLIGIQSTGISLTAPPGCFREQRLYALLTLHFVGLLIPVSGSVERCPWMLRKGPLY